MSRRKCCCKLGGGGGDDPPPPPPPPGPCREDPLYTTESINHGFDYSCNPRGPDGFEYDDFCNRNRIIQNFLDQNDNQIVDNYSGKHWSVANTYNGFHANAFYFAGNTGGLANHQGPHIQHRFHIRPENVLQAGYLLNGSIDLGFERWNRLDIDAAGWGGNTPIPLLNHGPYPDNIYHRSVIGDNFNVVSVSQNVSVANGWSLGLPYADAYYETTIGIYNPSGTTTYASSTFNTPLSHFYNAFPTSSFSMEVTNVTQTNGSQYELTLDFNVTHGGSSLVLDDLVIRVGPCWLHSNMYGSIQGTQLRKLASDPNGTGVNQYTTYPDGLALAASHPNVAFCFSGIDNFIWNS